MSKANKILISMTLFAVILTFIVVILGAYTRLTDAGLGCPDWPGCYNRLVAPTSLADIKHADSLYPAMPVHVTKAWTEMVHRYAAGLLGLLIFTLAVISIRRRQMSKQPILIPIILIAMVIFQALLGKWTVTMKLLPVVVMSHLLGGFIILGLLWWLTLKSGNYFSILKSTKTKSFQLWAVLGLMIVAIQVTLGGWTSTNYAALVCLNFPYCSTQQFFPLIDFHQAFDLFNFSNDRLSSAALITIQMTHRFGALITALYVGILSIYLMTLKRSPLLQRIGLVMLILLFIQILLGILNVKLLLPLSIAVLHNFVAALLLLAMVTLVYASFLVKRCND